MSSAQPATPRGYLAALSASSEELKVLRVSRKRADTVPNHFGMIEEITATPNHKSTFLRFCFLGLIVSSQKEVCLGRMPPKISNSPSDGHKGPQISTHYSKRKES
jgi:hypothetical protein